MDELIRQTMGSDYRGRVAPSPTGLLHLGHARTFWAAHRRAEEAEGTLVFRNEDLDPERCRPEFAQAMMEDLRWLSVRWQEGPDVGGAYGPYQQSQRRESYLAAWKRLKDAGAIYPCGCSRKELREAAGAPQDDDDEPVYPGRCRARVVENKDFKTPAGVNWRFRVPDGESVEFMDGNLGHHIYVAGKDFGDFAVWRRDDVPAYQLAVVVDDEAMHITEVVRGADLLRSTARQLLLQRALECRQPGYFHCELVCDDNGMRLAKRHDALSLRALRDQGKTAAEVIESFAKGAGSI